MLITIVVACCLIWLLTLRWKRRDLETLYQQIKISAPRLPIIGHMYLFLCSEEKRMKLIQRGGKDVINSGGIAGFWMAHRLYIHVADSEVADIIMKSCLEKDDAIKCFHLVTGEGSVFTSVAKWRPRRKYLSPTFGMKYLNCYVKTFSRLSRNVVQKIDKERNAGTDIISMEKVYLLYTMNAVLGSLGIGISVQENTDHPFPLALEELMSAMITRMFYPWLYSDFVYKLLPRYQKIKRHITTVFEMLHKIIQENREKVEKNTNSSPHDISMGSGLKTFIELLIESPANISDVAIREECVVMIAAASDTSAVSLGYITLMLARYPEEQDKIYKELKEVIVDLNRPIMSEDLPRLKYLDAFIREALRLYPPVPIILRKTDRSIELPSGITLVPGCGIYINIWAINRNPLYWGKDAEEFRPARFLEPESRHPAAFMTFSYGPRNCLGNQYAMISMKTVIATILSKYCVKAASEELKHEPLRVKYNFMMRHLDKYRVRFKPR